MANPLSDVTVTGVDRLSDLPRHLHHHIMAFLHWDDSIRISSVSKHFTKVWQCFPIVEFDYTKFLESNPSADMNDFVDYVCSSLRRRELKNDLERLTFTASFKDNEEENASVLITKLIAFGFKHKVQEIFFKCLLENRFISGFPNAIFRLEIIKTISLEGFELNGRNLVLQCPMLEHLYLGHSTAVNTIIRISCRKLKTTKIDSLQGIRKILIDEKTRSIESFIYDGAQVGRQCHIVNLGSCKALKTLQLHCIDVDGNWLNREVSQLVLLESLKLRLCRDLKVIQIDNNRLESMELASCENLEKVDIASPNVSRFWYSARRWLLRPISSDLDLSKCQNIRDLAIKGASGFMTDDWITKNVSTLKFLERFVLNGCDSIKSLSLCLDNLKHLELITCIQLGNFEIHAPNLVSFIYEGDVLPLPPTSICSTKLNAELRFSHSFNIINLDKELRNFLSFFDHCKSLTLVFLRDMPFVTFGTRLTMVSPLYDLKNLIIKMSSIRAAKITQMVEILLWLAPRLDVVSVHYDNIPFLTLKFHYSTLKCPEVHGKNQLQCCSSQIIKCWRHDLTKVEVKTFEGLKTEEVDLARFFTNNANAEVVLITL